MHHRIERRLVIVGDSTVGAYTPPKSPVLDALQDLTASWIGKTSLCIAFGMVIFPEVCVLHSEFVPGRSRSTTQDYIPTVMDGFSISIEANKRTVQLTMHDTSAHRNFERLRPLLYKRAHAVLICFSVVDVNSLRNIEENWTPEVRGSIGHSVSVYLVGCKSDLRTDPHTLSQLALTGQTVTPEAQGEKMAKRIGAAGYFECASKTGEGLRQLFLHVIDAMDDESVSLLNASRRKAGKETRCVAM